MTQKRKKRSAYVKLLPSVLCIAVTLFAGLAASMAWFSMNDKVNASGMKVTLDTADAYLVIAASPQDLLNADSSDVSVSYSGGAHSYVPVTHDSNSSPCQLKYITNGAGVNAETGLADTMSFADVPAAEDNGTYYFAEFDVYIGALFCELTGTDLVAAWNDTLTVNSTTDRQKAASIDFYVYNENEEVFEYKASTNLAGGQPVTLLEDTVIPRSDSGDYICVRMRFYFDGGLTYDNNGTQIAYIRTGAAVASDVSLGITFRAD